MIWFAKHPQARPEMLGFIPGFLSEEDPRPAAEQIAANYAHGGGWRPFKGFWTLPDGRLKYPGDPPLTLLYEAHLRDEVIRFYEPGSWLAIIQPDGKFEVSRMD